MLAELAACNAAFAIIKTTLQNTGEIAGAGKALANYFDNKSELQKQANKKGQGSKRSDLEEFLALEQLKKQEDELKELMIWSGRPGMWQDWIKFQAEAARARREEEAKIAREKALREQRWFRYFEYSLATILGAAGLAVAGFIVWLIATKGGTQ